MLTNSSAKEVQDTGDKSLGLPLSFWWGHVFSSLWSNCFKRLQVFRVALWWCSLNVFVFEIMSPHHSDHKRQKSLGLLRSFFFSKCVWVSYSVTQSLTGWPIDLSSDSEWTAKKAKSSPIWRKIHLADGDGVICWWIAGLCIKGDNTTFAFQPPLSFSIPVIEGKSMVILTPCITQAKYK